VRTKLADLGRLERILAETISRCSGDSVPSCPVLDMPETPERAYITKKS
jgi:MerR family transcriptional regulator, mercuric resistance operon regulatory protein